MRAITVELSSSLQKIELVPMADTHIGDRYADTHLLHERVDYVLNTPNAFALFNGDLGNYATKNSPSDIYGEALSPMEQLKQITAIIGPIKHKTIAVTPGNHEARLYKNDGIDITRLICRELGIEDKYSDGAAIIFLRFGELSRGKLESNGSGNIRKMCYTIYMNHGSGGGRKEGAKAIRLADMASIIDADVYIHSHTHLPMIMKESYFRIDTRNNAYRPVDKLFVNTGASLRYGGYGESYEFKPSSTATPHIFLSGTARELNAML